jgi:hypothetical protein
VDVVVVVLIPAADAYSDVERAWIDQDSFWGQQRKVFSGYMKDTMFDPLVQFYANMSPATCDESDIANWERMLNIPVDANKSLAYRRAFVQIRRYRGAFTRSFRRQVVELFVTAASGSPILFFTVGGLFFSDDDPLLFGSGDFDPTTEYTITEDIPGFSYEVDVLESAGIDSDGLYRELKRVTPSPIDANFSLNIVSSLT